MSGLIDLSERAVEQVLEQLSQGDSSTQIASSMTRKQFEELLALMWFGASKNARFGFAWHRQHSPLSFVDAAELSPDDLRRGLFRLRAEVKLVHSAA